MRNISNIIIHCSDSPWGCTREIRQWHLKRGFSDIGYHFVILNGRPTFNHSKNNVYIPALDGSVECGRYLDDDDFLSDREVGAHTLGYNTDSIGICLIGVNQFTDRQQVVLRGLCLNLIGLYNLSVSHILGHYETESGKKEGKTCPNIDIGAFRLSFIGG